MAKRKSKRWTKTDVEKGPKPSKGNTGAPMCRLCKTRHWGREPHHFAPEPKPNQRRREDGIQLDDVGVKQ